MERGIWRMLVIGPTRHVLPGLARGEGDDAPQRFTREDVERLLAQARARWNVVAQDLPIEPSISGRISVVAAGMLLALAQALTADGIERSYANRLVRDISWAAYMRSMGKGMPGLMRTLAPNPQRRLKAAMDIGLKLEFTEPSYRHRRVSFAGGDGFDMLRCPIADYLKSQDASDLCVTAFCSLDFRIFELIDLQLERSGTIAGGAELCDFRAYPRGDLPTRTAVRP